MKKTLVIFPIFMVLLLLTPRSAQAQFEAKAGPLGLLFGSVSLAAEYGFSDNFGAELHTFLDSDESYVWATGRYYFNPQRGLDRFHAGFFMAAGSDGVGPGVGLMLGQKWVSRNNVLLDAGIGLGRSFDGDFIPYAKLQIGYRFGNKKWY